MTIQIKLLWMTYSEWWTVSGFAHAGRYLGGVEFWLRLGRLAVYLQIRRSR